MKQGLFRRGVARTEGILGRSPPSNWYGCCSSPPRDEAQIAGTGRYFAHRGPFARVGDHRLLHAHVVLLARLRGAGGILDGAQRLLRDDRLLRIAVAQADSVFFAGRSSFGWAGPDHPGAGALACAVRHSGLRRHVSTRSRAAPVGKPLDSPHLEAESRRQKAEVSPFDGPLPASTFCFSAFCLPAFR